MPRGRKTVLADWEAKAKARKAGPALLVDAINAADLDAVRTLVANGARLNPTYETSGAFPLATACDLVQSPGSPAMRVVKLLVDLGADVNHRAPGSAARRASRQE